MKRQLNLYGFRLIQRGDNKGYFFQPEYRRSDITTARNIVRIGAPKKRKIIDDGVACKRNTRRRPAADDVDDAEEDTIDPYLHVSSESEHDDNICDNIQIRHDDKDDWGRDGGDEISPTIPVQHTIYSSSSSSNDHHSNHNNSTFRPSALSSRLGFNMNLLNRFPKSNYSNHQPSHPNPPVVIVAVPHPAADEASSNEQGSHSNQPVTYGDIDSMSSDLYAIGPSFPNDKMMFPCSSTSQEEECGYNVKAFNIDEMLEFLDTL